MPEAKDDAPERPKIYVTKKGARYVKADELLRSKRGRARVEEMKQLMARMKAAKEREKPD